MEVGSSAVVVPEKQFPLRDDVEKIRSDAKVLSSKLDRSDLIEEYPPVNVADKYEMKCEYIVGGGLEAAAHCVVTSKDDNHVAAEAAWVFTVNTGPGLGTEPAVKFAYCYRGRDYLGNPDIFMVGDNYKPKFDEYAKKDPDAFVCLEGWLDNSAVFQLRKQMKFSGLEEEAAEELSEAFKELTI